MGDENPIRTLGVYSKPIQEGYRNTIELPEGNNVVPFQSDTIRLVQNGRTIKLCNHIILFQQHQVESLSEAWTRLKDLLQQVPHHGIDLWLQASLEDLALYDNESWNDPRELAKPIKAISFLQYVPVTSDRRLIELENQVQHLMEARLASMQPTQVNKITSSCESCSGPHDTQYCMENPKQAFVEYASSRTNEAGDPQCSSHPSTSINVVKTYSKETSHFQTSQLQIGMRIGTPQIEEPEPTLEDEFQDFHLNLPGEVSEKMEDPGLFTLPCRLENSKPFDILVNLGSCVNIIPLYLFKKLNIRLLEETDQIFGLADGTKSYPVGIVKDVEVHIEELKLLNDFYVIDMKKEPKTPLLVRRGFLATVNAVIDCRKAKIAIGEGITRSVFGVKEVNLGEEEAP
nr:hypothetical protein [Tanacetum cinerariifolium]